MSYDAQIQDIFPFAVQEPVVSSPSPPEAFTAALSWTSAGSVVDSYEVMWQRDTSGECPDDEDMNSTNITDGSTRAVIMGLFGISTYRITVRATNEAGTALSNELLVMTTEAGNRCSLVGACVCVYGV